MPLLERTTSASAMPLVERTPSAGSLDGRLPSSARPGALAVALAAAAALYVAAMVLVVPSGGLLPPALVAGGPTRASPPAALPAPAPVRLAGPAGEATAPPPRRLIVLTSQRSGSTYLCAALAHRLWGRGFVTWTEPLMPSQWVVHGWAPEAVVTAFGWDAAAAWPLYERRLDETFEEALALHREGFPARPAEVLGFKLMLNQLPEPLWPHLLEYLARRDVHLLQLTRVNGLEVFLSKADALAKGQWHSYEGAGAGAGPGASPMRHRVEPETLQKHLTMHACAARSAHARVAGALAADRYQLVPYETLLAHGDREVARVLAFLGIDPAEARGADVVDGQENWVRAYVPTKLAAAKKRVDRALAGEGEGGGAAAGNPCLDRITNRAEVAALLAGSLELRLCAYAAGSAGEPLTQADVRESLEVQTFGGEARPLACPDTPGWRCRGEPSTVNGCVDGERLAAAAAEATPERGAGVARRQLRPLAWV